MLYDLFEVCGMFEVEVVWFVVLCGMLVDFILIWCCYEEMMVVDV